MFTTRAAAHWKRIPCGILPALLVGLAAESSWGQAFPAVQDDNALATAIEAAFVPPVNEPLVPASVPALIRPLASQFYSGGSASQNSWHLSVINGGRPRGEPTNKLTSLSAERREPFEWVRHQPEAGQWFITSAKDRSSAAREIKFGLAGALPITGDFDGDGKADVGVFLDGLWLIDLNGNGRWDENDLQIRLGSRGDLPVTGDFDGDGKTDIGIFGPAWSGDAASIASEAGLPDAGNQNTNAAKNLPAVRPALGFCTMLRTAKGTPRSELVDHVFHYGIAGDVPLTGDWNGDGIDTIGIFRRGHWVLDTDGDGQFSSSDAVFDLGTEQDLPVVGDFNGDGIDEIGVYRRGAWHIDSNGDRILGEGDLLARFGGPHDRPVVGDFDGEGRDLLGLYRANR
jgi:serine-aspartate repeat-containing protein C/D/E